MTEKCVKPIEMLWHNPKSTVLTRQRTNIEELWPICGEGWSKIDKRS